MHCSLAIVSEAVEEVFGAYKAQSIVNGIHGYHEHTPESREDRLRDTGETDACSLTRRMSNGDWDVVEGRAASFASHETAQCTGS